LDITLSANPAAHAAFDAPVVTIAASNTNVGAGVVFDTAGAYTITVTANGYASGSASTTAAGALVLMQPGTPGVFVPPSVTIKAGQYVTWRNADAINHTTIDDTGLLWNSGTLAPAASFQQYFGTAGSFTYHCAIHPAMTGTIVVNP